MMNALSNSRIFLNNAPPAPPTPEPPAPPTPDELYQAVDQLLVELKPALGQQPELKDQIAQMSGEVKTAFKDQLVNLPAAPETAEQARQATLQALAAGLVAGALDGAVLLHSDAASKLAAPSAQPEGIGEEIGKAFDRFVEQLQQELAQACEKMKEMSKEALQEMSAQGKDFGRTVVDRSDAFAGGNKMEFQGYMAAAFGLGYAVGGTDAAIVMLTDQVPGQPPQQPPQEPPQQPQP